MRAHLMAVVLLAGSAREAELAVGECEAKLLEQRQTIASLQSTAASISRVKAEAAAAQHERDTMAEQLRAALEQTRKMEIACQEWIAEMQREARLSMARHSSFPVGATVRAHSGADCPAAFAQRTLACVSVFCWIAAGASPSRDPEQPPAESRASAALRAELEALRASPWYQLSSLQQHGLELGLSPQKLAEATGRPHPEKELVTLILEATGSSPSRRN